MPTATRMGIGTHICLTSKPVLFTPHLLPPSLITGNLYHPTFTFLLFQLPVKVLVKNLLLKGRASPYYITGPYDYRTTNQNGQGRFAMIKGPTRFSKRE